MRRSISGPIGWGAPWSVPSLDGLDGLDLREAVLASRWWLGWNLRSLQGPLWLFGSTARGTAQHDSDIDLLTVTAAEPSAVVRSAARISALAGRTFELITPEIVALTPDPLFVERVQRDWICLNHLARRSANPLVPDGE